MHKAPKKGIRTKHKAQPPPNPVSSDGFITDDDPDATLRDVMTPIKTLSTQVAVNEERLVTQTQQGTSSFSVNIPYTSSDTRVPENEPETVPPFPPETDALQGLEDTVRARIAERLQGVPAGCLPGTDEDADHDYPPNVVAGHLKHGSSGKLRTADTVVVKTLTWPHEVLYTPSAHPIVYDNILTMSFSPLSTMLQTSSYP